MGSHATRTSGSGGKTVKRGTPSNQVLERSTIKIERADDPIWNGRGRRLLEFLKEPRTWSELCRWGRQQSMGGERIRHALAHIGDAFRVVVCRDQKIRWAALEVPVEGEDLKWLEKQRVQKQTLPSVEVP